MAGGVGGEAGLILAVRLSAGGGPGRVVVWLSAGGACFWLCSFDLTAFDLAL